MKRLLIFIWLWAFLRAEEDLHWRPLENAPSELENFTLCLTTVPWCGESRSFMHDFVELIKREQPELQGLQLRYVHSRTEKRSLILYHVSGAYKFPGHPVPSAPHVLASVQHVLSTNPSDAPIRSLNSARELQKFVGSTDHAFVLVDFCGWVDEIRNKDEKVIVEDYQSDEGTGFEFDWIHEKALDGLGGCSPVEKQVFQVLYHNLTELANLNFLTPYAAKVGVIRSVQVLEDAEVAVPKTSPWILMRRAEDLSQSWQFLTDADQLLDFLENSTIVVDEGTTRTELPRNKPSVLLFLQRGTYLQNLRDESINALNIVREVARDFASVYPVKLVSSSVVEQPTFSTASFRNEQTLEKPDYAEFLSQFLLDKKRNFRVEDGKTQHAENKSSENELRESQLRSEGSNEDETVIVEEDVGEPDLPDDSKEEENASTFYFGHLEGADRLQESFTGKSGTGPSLVVIFPEREAYYVYPDHIPIGVSSLTEFLERALAGYLPPHARSGPTPTAPREPVRPPFVNLDFHQVQSLPHVTVDTFSELVLGMKKVYQPDDASERLLQEAAGERNVLVVFTLPWCGFCKRMELAVHEVHRVYLNSRLRSQNGTARREQEAPEVPIFYQMDCTLNHCSQILATIMEEEEFPAVVLFPARRKNQPMLFRDSPTVRNMFQFLATHGSCHDYSSSTIKIHDTAERKRSMARLPDRVSEDIISIQIGVGNVFLASELLESETLQGSTILIISVTEEHLMGLVLNKPMQWEQISSLDSQLQNTRRALIGYGGPVLDNSKHLFALTSLQDIEGFVKVTDELYAGGPSSTEKVVELIEAEKLSPSDFRLFSGYCGWTLPQFQAEFVAGYWQITHFNQSMLLDGDAV